MFFKIKSFCIGLFLFTSATQAQVNNQHTTNSTGGGGQIGSNFFEYSLGETFTASGFSASVTNQQGILQPLSASPLPVTGMHLAIQKNGNTAVLYWKTFTEINNKGFYVERKIPGANNFAEIQFVPSAALNGNSINTLSYKIEDINNHSGITLYRLRQVDIDNHFAYSNIAAYENGSSAIALTAWPIPSNGAVNLLLTGSQTNTVTSVYDAVGKLVTKMVLKPGVSSTHTFSAKGVYFIKLDNTSIAPVKVVVE